MNDRGKKRQTGLEHISSARDQQDQLTDWGSRCSTVLITHNCHELHTKPLLITKTITQNSFK